MHGESIWHVLFEGSGSATGNDWIEEVCYLGQEKWVLSLRDDPAWSVHEVNVQEPTEYPSSHLASWVVEMDCADADEEHTRAKALLDIAIAESAKECESALRAHLDGPPKDNEGSVANSPMALSWARVARLRSVRRCRPGGDDDDDQSRNGQFGRSC